MISASTGEEMASYASQSALYQDCWHILGYCMPTQVGLTLAASKVKWDVFFFIIRFAGMPINMRCAGIQARILCRAPQLFDSTSTIDSFGERFRDGKYSSVSCLLAVLLLTVPHPCPAIC